VASCTTVIGRYVGSRRWRSTIDRTAAFVEAEHAGEELNRPVEILGVLADDRDAVRPAVVDQNLAVAIEHQTARRSEGKRPLMVVLGHLLELRVLHHLQHPEADRQHREQDGDDVLQDR
jgi:hypothetical protein